MQDKWLARFKKIVSQPPDKINLAEAALVIAGDEYPDLNVKQYQARLDELANRIRPRLREADPPETKLEQLNHFLFDELGFRGNREFYYDPRNSYLNDVLNSRVGLPITLSIVYLEVGWRLGFPLFGVGLPGHFIIKWHDHDSEIFLDPFNEGQVIDEFGLSRLLEGTYQRPVQIQRDWLQAVGPAYILERVLNNLKGIFMHGENLDRALLIVEKLLLLEPHSEEHLREAGLLSFRVGSYRRAASFLEEYLIRHPESRSADHVRIYLRSAWVAIARLN